jgi:hypothetical protein
MDYMLRPIVAITRYKEYHIAISADNTLFTQGQAMGRKEHENSTSHARRPTHNQHHQHKIIGIIPRKTRAGICEHHITI